MRDEQDMRMWQEHHDAFTAQIGELFQQIMQAFRVLHRIEWSAPWRKGRC